MVPVLWTSLLPIALQRDLNMHTVLTVLTRSFLICSRFDVRGRPFKQALFWSDPLAFGPRAYFVTGKLPIAALQLDSVQLKDAGVYRCRVDYRNSPTRNFQVKLTVIGEQNIIIQSPKSPSRCHETKVVL